MMIPKIITFVTVFIAFFGHGCVCSFVQFYAEENYTGFIDEVDLTGDKQNQCIEVRNKTTGSEYEPIAITSVKTDRCLIFYAFPNCSIGGGPSIFGPMPEGRTFVIDVRSFRVDGNAPNIDNHPLVYSFHVCSQKLGGGPELDVDFYKHTSYHGEKILEMRNVCGCKNVPAHLNVGRSSEISIDNHGNGMELFEGQDCQGRSKSLVAGASMYSERVFDPFDISRFNVRSFRQTGLLSCVKLTSTIYKFQFRNGTNLQNVVTEKVKMAATTILRSSGKVKTVQEYSVTSKVAETVDYTLSSSYSNMETIGVDASFEAKVEGGIPLVAAEEARWKVAEMFRYQRTDGGGTTNRTSVVNEETVGIRQNFEMAPCQECKISSFIKKVKNFPIEYDAFARVRGTASGIPMSAAEVKKYLLAGLEYKGDVDEYTVDTVLTGVMYAEFGVNAFVVAECVPIPNCTSTYSSAENPKVQRVTYEVPLVRKNKITGILDGIYC